MEAHVYNSRTQEASLDYIANPFLKNNSINSKCDNGYCYMNSIPQFKNRCRMITVLADRGTFKLGTDIIIPTLGM